MPDLSRHSRSTLLVAALLLSNPAAALERYRLSAPEEVLELLTQYLPDPEQSFADDDESARLGLVRRLREATRALLATEGYFSPQVTLEAGTPPVLKVDPGVRTRVTAVDIQFSGDLAEKAVFQPDAERFKRRWGLKVDEAFREQEWADAKERLLQRAQARYFAAARLTDSLADIDPEHATAALTLRLDSGPAYRLGPLQIEGLQDYKPWLIERFNPLRVGEDYSLEGLQALQAALQATPYFSYVEVSADPSAAQDDVLPVRVVVQEAKPKRFSTGIGYSTNTGGRLDAGWRDANWLSRAWLLNANLRLEQRQRAAVADVFLPPDAAGRRNSFGAIAESSHISGLSIRRQAIGVASATRQGDIERRLGLSLQGETSQSDGAERSHKQALALDWQWTRRKVDNVLNPRDGHSLSVRLSAASRYVLSDADFVRSWARVAWWHPFGRRDILNLRAEAGYTVAKSRLDVPQEFLFRTGGAQSVRGYDYLSLGVRDGQAIVGGRYLSTATVEYTHWLTSSAWGMAGFVDVGDAGDHLSGLRARVGSGLGARWRSPAGPLALDLAYGWQERRLRAHLSIALAF